MGDRGQDSQQPRPAATTPDVVVSAGHVRAFCCELLATTGMPADAALLLAEALVDADLHGVETHGVVLLPNYIRRLQRGGINPRADVRTIHDTPVSAVVGRAM